MTQELLQRNPNETQVQEFQVPPNFYVTPKETMMEHMSPDWVTGLGRKAVDARMLDAEEARNGYEPNDDPKFFNNRYHRKGLQEARAALAGLRSFDKKIFNREIQSENMGVWLKGRLGIDQQKAFTPNYAKILTAKHSDGSYTVDDTTFTNFLEWHNYKLADKQAKLNEQATGFKEQFRDKFWTAVGKGWIPDSAAKNLERLDRTLLVVDDRFMTTYRDAAAYQTEDYSDNTNIIAYSPELIDLSNIRTHEFMHAVDGRNEGSLIVDEGSGRFSQAYGLTRLLGDKQGGSAINEAMTEHLAQSLEHGDFDTINPSERKDDPKIYSDARILLDILANKGFHKIDIRDFAAAFFESGEEAEARGDESAAKQLELKLTTAFPFTDVVKEIRELGGEYGLADIGIYAGNLQIRAKRYALLPKFAAKIATHSLEPGSWRLNTWVKKKVYDQALKAKKKKEAAHAAPDSVD